MNDDDRGTNLERTIDKGPRAPSFSRRVVEWFSRGAAIDTWLRSARLSSGIAFEHPRRARLCADLAEVALSSADPLAEALACDLFRQAAYWTLCALSPDAARDSEGQYSEGIWASLQAEWLESFALTSEERERLQSALRSGNFVYFSALPIAEQTALRGTLRDLYVALSGKLEQARAGLHRLRRQRVIRWSGLALLAVAILVGGLLLRASIARARDLANSATWRTSSGNGTGGCTSPLQECNITDSWFFHTRENDRHPWIEFTLDRPRAVSEVVVENREDCCGERAIPLTIEVSDDQEHWREVAERSEPFTTWRATFPSVQTRFVRLRVKRRTTFHLHRVRIFS